MERLTAPIGSLSHIFEFEFRGIGEKREKWNFEYFYHFTLPFISFLKNSNSPFSSSTSCCFRISCGVKFSTLEN